jgi:cyclase
MSTAHVSKHMDIPPPAVEEVSEGVFAYIQLDGSWGLNNTGFIVGDDAVTVVDTCFTERRTRAFIDAIGKVTGLPLRTLVNTHHHVDHTHGNYLIPGATIIAHELCREAVIRTGTPSTNRNPMYPHVQWGDIKLHPPFVTFQDRLNIYAGDLKIEAIFAGPAHTTNDTILWIPERRLLFSGDLLFNGGTPFVMMGSVAGSLQALERLRGLGAETIVPGHGLVCGPEVIGEVAAYLRFVQETARKTFDAGLSPLEAARQTDLGKFANLQDKERLVGNLHRAYSEIRGEPLGTMLEFPKIVSEMIEFNGGPVRCLA